MKLIKMRRSGALLEVRDRKARIYVDIMGIATYLNERPIVKDPIPIKSNHETELEKIEKPKRTYKRRNMQAEDDKPKKRHYKRRNLIAEDEW